MEKSQCDLARALFATAMSLAEQAAVLALTGQTRRHSRAHMSHIAQKLQTNAETIALIAAAIGKTLGKAGRD